MAPTVPPSPMGNPKLKDNGAYQIAAPCAVTQEERAGCDSNEELTEQALQTTGYEKPPRLYSMSNRPPFVLDCGEKETLQQQKAFGSDHLTTGKSFELLTSVYSEVGRPERSDALKQHTADPVSVPSTTKSLNDALSAAPPQTLQNTNSRSHYGQNSSSTQTLKKKQICSCKCPPSILRKKPSVSSSDSESSSQRKKSERRVRFQEPDEIFVHDISYCECLSAYDYSTTHLSVFLLGLVCLLLCFLATILYCTNSIQPLKTYEELESKLLVYFLQMKDDILSCCTWFLKD
ncbi:nutritionally-regulated adipose and cardiac enriched protein homolog [Latimeria chalumnae]|uniref:nutritionally-regulated adipose and cardiac enriched protein homolog n=1 Tax=Latimeria chalumnae TaxID=7897 RepID=UPI0006D8D913|nr:PREDICTED: uncharacterized protein LOC102367368 [Latimeria chalumnae]|eukprot:XP_005988016.2 PREDICTED: uncharacterized protein LOC102367368 [Latimeria chalumnae]